VAEEFLMLKKFPGISRAQQGFVLVTAVVLIVVAALVLTVIVYFSVIGNQSTVRHLGSKQALFVASTGLEHGVHALLSPDLGDRLDCAAISGAVGMTNIAFGDGRFTVTSGAPLYSNPVVTLNGAINATVTVIPLNSAFPVPGYATSGRVMIDREKIDYSEISNDAAECGTPPCLLGAQRGVDGTAAAAHANGTRIGQYQCALISAGGVPDFGAPRGDRVITAGIQLQEAWAVGENGVILRWDGVNWAVLATTGTRLRAVSMDSYANGWSVGDLTGGAAQIRRWNPDGTPAWDTVAYPGIPSDQRLNSVHVLSANEAWAVGNDRAGGGNNTMVLRFNGANWVYSDPGIDRDLNGVYMLDTNNDGVADDGWAVGDNGVILRWNGAAWNVSVAPNVLTGNNLLAVTCATPSDCWAVGVGGVIAHWNGVAWALHPQSGAVTGNDLHGIHITAARRDPQAAWREIYQ
jgi:hypothetical protein